MTMTPERIRELCKVLPQGISWQDGMLCYLHVADEDTSWWVQIPPAFIVPKITWAALCEMWQAGIVVLVGKTHDGEPNCILYPQKGKQGEYVADTEAEALFAAYDAWKEGRSE